MVMKLNAGEKCEWFLFFFFFFLRFNNKSYENKVRSQKKTKTKAKQIKRKRPVSALSVAAQSHVRNVENKVVCFLVTVVKIYLCNYSW